MKFLGCKTATFGGVIPADEWCIPAEGRTHRDAALALIQTPGFNPPGPAVYWLHLAEDAPNNRHLNGRLRKVHAFEINVRDTSNVKETHGNV